MADNKVIYWGVGRRKAAVARVRLVSGDGKIRVNKKPVEVYFKGHDVLQNRIMAPLKLVDITDQYNVFANVNGGGKTGQAEAIRHGISRALLKVNGELRGALKKAGFLTRDSRIVERKKPGQPKARKKFQYSKR